MIKNASLSNDIVRSYKALHTSVSTLAHSRERALVLTKLDEARLWLREISGLDLDFDDDR